MHLQRLAVFLFLVLFCTSTPAQVTITRGASMSVDTTADGRLAIDLHGDIWIIPGGGGDAARLTRNLRSAQRPRWAPNAEGLVYEADAEGQQGLWLYDFETEQSRFVSERSGLDRHAAWHPSGERIIYASDRDGRGFDLWETDVATGLHWRISYRRGDATEPAWSANGRDLVYVNKEGDTWSLVMRRFGAAEEVLVRSSEKISAPTWRPDGSLITWFQELADGVVLKMVILSQPRMVRVYEESETLDPFPVSWLDRHRMYYTANGFVRQRLFNSWTSAPLQFRATLQPEPIPVVSRERPQLAWIDEPLGELVIHAARMFDGIQSEYQYNKDILIRGGRIVGVEDHVSRDGKIVINMGDLTVLPGFIDADAKIPGNLTASHGPDLLTMGITTVVAEHHDAQRLNELWSGKAVPGPRLHNGPEWHIGPQPRPELDVTAAVSSSHSTGRQTGVALPAQFRAMQIAGLTEIQTLRSIGVNAAGAMLADPYLGRISIGAAADLVFVDGDPLQEIAAALNVVAVVRNGRFYSVSGLIDRAKSAESVE